MTSVDLVIHAHSYEHRIQKCALHWLTHTRKHTHTHTHVHTHTNTHTHTHAHTHTDRRWIFHRYGPSRAACLLLLSLPRGRATHTHTRVCVCGATLSPLTPLISQPPESSRRRWLPSTVSVTTSCHRSTARQGAVRGGAQRARVSSYNPQV